MDPLEELRTVAIQQNMEGEFPDWLLAEVLRIADHPDRYREKLHLVETLIEQLRHFDPYAGAGCFDTSVSAEAIQATIYKMRLR